jgi:hypothetical protein
VSFQPREAGARPGKLFFFYNGNESPTAIPLSGQGIYQSETVTYEANKWTLVSAPLLPSQKYSLPRLYSYNGGYKSEDSLVLGKGYWAKPAGGAVTYQGRLVDSVSIAVTAGWNLVGSVSHDVAASGVTTNPDSIRATPFYGYRNGAYIAVDTLKPGMGYWVRMRGSGSLKLEAH